MKIIANNVGNYRNKRDNCLWYSGNIINIETNYGSYKISTIGSLSCILKAKKDFIDANENEHQQGEILVDVSSNNSQDFLDIITEYITSDDELIKTLIGENEKYSIDFHNNKSIKIDVYDKEGRYKESLNPKSTWINSTLEQVFNHIKENRSFDYNKNSIYCRCANYSDVAILNQLNSCKRELLSKNNDLNDSNINYYIDNGFSSTDKLPPSLELLLDDLDVLKEHNIVTTNINRLTRDSVKIVQIHGILEKSNSDIFLVQEDEYFNKGIYNNNTLNAVEMIMYESNQLDVEMERDY